MINCIPFKYTGIVDHCIGCDNIIPFDGNGHCFICGCDHPHSSIDDESISQEDFESEVNLFESFIINPNDRPIFKTPPDGQSD